MSNDQETTAIAIKFNIAPDDIRAIQDYPDYWVSRCGRCFSTKRNAPLELSTRTSNSNHVLVDLTQPAEGRSTINLHKLVLIAFKGPRPGPEFIARHIDGNHANNSADNLEWASRSQNMRDAWRFGSQGRNKISDDQVSFLRFIDPLLGASNKVLSSTLGLTPNYVAQLLRGLWRKDVEPFNADPLMEAPTDEELDHMEEEGFIDPDQRDAARHIKGVVIPVHEKLSGKTDAL